MSDLSNARLPETKPTFSGGPPLPPTLTAQGLADPPGDPGKRIFLTDSMQVRDLALALGIKPFKVVADLMELKLFKSPDDALDFATAARVVRKHGYRAERPPPGVLVL